MQVLLEATWSVSEKGKTANKIRTGLILVSLALMFWYLQHISGTGVYTGI